MSDGIFALIFFHWKASLWTGLFDDCFNDTIEYFQSIFFQFQFNWSIGAFFSICKNMLFCIRTVLFCCHRQLSTDFLNFSSRMRVAMCEPKKATGFMSFYDWYLYNSVETKMIFCATSARLLLKLKNSKIVNLSADQIAEREKIMNLGLQFTRFSIVDAIPFGCSTEWGISSDLLRCFLLSTPLSFSICFRCESTVNHFRSAFNTCRPLCIQYKFHFIFWRYTCKMITSLKMEAI